MLQKISAAIELVAYGRLCVSMSIRSSPPACKKLVPQGSVWHAFHHQGTALHASASSRSRKGGLHDDVVLIETIIECK